MTIFCNRSKDWIFGGLTLSLAFLPFMFAMLRKQSCEAFYQLPGVHIVRNFQTCLKSQNLKLITANLECEKEKAEDCEEKEKFDLQIDYFNDKLRNLSSDSQVDKSYQAILESGLQFLLQTTINYYQFGEFGWLVWLKVSSPLTKFQILSSFVSVIVTLTKMLFDLPVQVGNKMVKRRDYKSCRSTVETGWKYYRGKLAYVASASIIPLLVIGSSLLATTLRDQMFGKHFNMFSWKMATFSLLAEMVFLGTCLHCYSCVNIRLKRGRLHEKAKECLILSGFAGLIFPSVICEFEENLVFVSGFFAAVCGIITPLVMTILVHVLDETSIDPKIFKDTNQTRNQTFTEEGHWSQFQNDMEKQLVWSCCVSLFTIAFFFFCNSIKGLYLHENWQYATQSKNISKVKDSMISMCPKSFGGLVNCSAFTFHFIQKCKYGWCMGYLPNLGMTQLVYATIVGFHECVDFLLDHENSSFVSKRSKEHTPQNAYVLLTEDNAEIFINDDENLNEVKEKIMELNTLSGKDLQLKLKALIRRNTRYFSKSALIIASEKKDIEMIKILILIKKLPTHLLMEKVDLYIHVTTTKMTLNQPDKPFECILNPTETLI